MLLVMIRFWWFLVCIIFRVFCVFWCLLRYKIVMLVFLWVKCMVIVCLMLLLLLLMRVILFFSLLLFW